MRLVSEMDCRGLPLDQYSITTVMRAARKAENLRAADRALAILDQKDVNIWEAELLFTAILDACIALHDKSRLAGILATYAKSGMEHGMLRQTGRCWDLWLEMLKRNIVLDDMAWCAGKAQLEHFELVHRGPILGLVAADTMVMTLTPAALQ